MKDMNQMTADHHMKMATHHHKMAAEHEKMASKMSGMKMSEGDVKGGMNSGTMDDGAPSAKAASGFQHVAF